MKQYEKLYEVQTASENIFDGKIFKVKRDTVTLPNGKETLRDIVRLLGAVGVIPVTEDGKVIIERQFRYPMQEVLTEIPAGKLDSAEEDHLSAAKRELEEETGITAEEWIDLGEYYPTPAYSDEKIYLYLAKGLHWGEQKLDEGEFLNVEQIPLTDLVEQVMNGEIRDGKTQVAILKAARYFEPMLFAEKI